MKRILMAALFAVVWVGIGSPAAVGPSRSPVIKAEDRVFHKWLEGIVLGDSMEGCVAVRYLAVHNEPRAIALYAEVIREMYQKAPVALLCNIITQSELELCLAIAVENIVPGVIAEAIPEPVTYIFDALIHHIKEFPISKRDPATLCIVEFYPFRDYIYNFINRIYSDRLRISTKTPPGGVVAVLEKPSPDALLSGHTDDPLGWAARHRPSPEKVSAGFRRVVSAAKTDK